MGHTSSMRVCGSAGGGAEPRTGERQRDVADERRCALGGIRLALTLLRVEPHPHQPTAATAPRPPPSRLVGSEM